MAYASSADTDTTAGWEGKPLTGTAPTVPGYEILGELGRGGMGVVYRARQVAVQRIVALKMVLDAEHMSPEFADRFRAEAEAAARLQHPNIVQLYEYGEAGGRPYFSLEFVDGGSFADRLRGAASIRAHGSTACHVGGSHGVCAQPRRRASGSEARQHSPFRHDAEDRRFRLGEAHGFRSGAHRDRGDSRHAELHVAGTGGRQDEHGRPSGGHLFARRDSLRMLGGATAVPRRATALETVLQVAGDDPVPPRQLRPETPSDLQTICLKCLAKDPRRRYATAQLLADDLRRFAAKEPISARPATRAERTRLWARRHPARAALYATLAGATLVVAALGIRHNIVLDAAYEQIRAEHVQARQQLVRRTVASGARLVDDGDFLGSLPWFVEALRLDDDPERDAIHRVRIAAVLRLCPQLLLVSAMKRR